MAKILKRGLKSRIPGIWRPARGGFYINPSRRGPAVPGGGWLGSSPGRGCPRAPGEPRRGLPGTPGPGDPRRVPRGPAARGWCKTTPRGGVWEPRGPVSGPLSPGEPPGGVPGTLSGIPGTGVPGPSRGPGVSRRPRRALPGPGRPRRGLFYINPSRRGPAVPRGPGTPPGDRSPVWRDGRPGQGPLWAGTLV